MFRTTLVLLCLFVVNTDQAGVPVPRGASTDSERPEDSGSAVAGITFTDITEQAGIRFTRNSGAAGRKLLPESVGGGGAFLDFDGDGRLDLLLVNGRDWKPRAQPSLQGLYRNLGGGRFADVTRGSGLDVELFGMGVAVADYDNDGRDDLYVTSLDGDRLFHNEGGGRFRDVTAASGITSRAFGTSAAWFDYDKDGKADLFVANYVKWTPETDVHCTYDGRTKAYCGPESYRGQAPRLFHNMGGGRFEDVTRAAGLDDPTGKALGVAVLDYNSDGWLDLFVANDKVPSKLYRNNGDGTFTDRAMRAGVAFSEEGVARANMGVDAADYDRSGRAAVLVGNFAGEMLGLYRNEGNELFVDEAPRSEVGRASLLNLTWAVFFFDYDLDGWLDLFTANGHIDESWTQLDTRVTYRQPPLLMRNLGARRFENVTARAGAPFSRPILARGAGYGDIDEDGDLDLFVTTNDGPAYLLRNDGGSRSNWLRVKTVGTRSTRNGLGAIVRIASRSGKQWQMVRTGSSYLSQSELTLTFGLGPDARVDVLEIDWPSGQKDRHVDVPANRTVIATEGKGLVSARREATASPVKDVSAAAATVPPR